MSVTEAVVSDPPTGVIAMLFTDIEGSTLLAATLGEAWAELLQDYHEIVARTVSAYGGWVDGVAGDGFFVTFADPGAAAQAAITIQRNLARHEWPDRTRPPMARMGVHVGYVERQAHGYVGLEVHRAARVGAAAHGGQLLLTGVAADLVGDLVPSQPLGAHRLKDFPAPIALFCAVIDGKGAADFPPPRTLELRAGNLPPGPVWLIGRDSDATRVRAALLDDDVRLVTLLGRGGVGKTTLALAVASDLLDHFSGGVWFVDASAERDADGLRGAIGRSCHAGDAGPFEDSLEGSLAGRGQILFVLDNLERVEGAGAVIESLLRRLPDLHVLGTSQIPLASKLERRVLVDCLAPDDGLHVLRESAERLGIELRDEASGAEIVALLEGLPLAIELAAGRLRMFAPDELLRRLRDSTVILQDRSINRPERQRSLEAALDWSLELLDSDAQALFARLGVFARPVEFDEIETVAGADGLDVAAAVETLLDVAVLRRVETGDGRLRLGLPEAVRQRAARRLEEVDADRWRHAHAVRQRDLLWPVRYFEIVDTRTVETAQHALAEADAALRWAWQHDPDIAREIAVSRAPLLFRSASFQEGSDLIDRVLADPAGDPRVDDFVRCLALSRDAYRGRVDDMLSSQRKLLAQLTDPLARLLLQSNICIHLSQDGQMDDALRECERVIALSAEFGPLAQASLLALKADLLFEQRRYDEAEAVIRQCDSLAGGKQSGGIDHLGITRAGLALARGRVNDALDLYARTLTAAEIAGYQLMIHHAMALLVPALSQAGRQRPMLEVHGICLAQAEERSAQGMGGLLHFLDEDDGVSQAIEQLGDEARSIIESGRAVPPSQRVKRACVLAFS